MSVVRIRVGAPFCKVLEPSCLKKLATKVGDGKVKLKVFITGGTTGIGAELAKIFQQRGAQVAVCGRDRDKYRQSFGDDSPITFYPMDVTNREGLLEAIRDFSCKGEKGLDIMVANAGISNSKKEKVIDFDTFHRILNVNIQGVATAFEGALEFMLEAKRGQLVAIASVAGFIGLPRAAAYCGSKAAVIRICESLAIDLQPMGIHTTCICPGFIDTPLTKKNRHSMPFIMSARAGAENIYRAIIRRKTLYIFPWPMKLAVAVLSSLPRFLYRPLVSRGREKTL